MTRGAPTLPYSEFAPTGKEAEKTLHAIVLGDADAIVVETPDGPRVYTLKDANEPYRQLVERMSDAAVVVDHEGTILYCNCRLATMLGCEWLIGRNFPDLVATEQRGRAEMLITSGIETSAEFALIADGGTRVGVRVSTAPMDFDEQHCVAMVVTALDDIAALKASEAALRDSEARLLLTQEAGGVGSWELDVETGIPLWSSAHFSLHALDPAECPPSYEAWRAAIHPDDRARADAIIQAAIAAGEAFEIDYRVVHCGGTIRWVTCRGRVELDADGRPVRVRGVTLDTTERKQGEEDLKSAKNEAERAVLARSKFLASASHDLRQPVQSLVLLLAAIKPQATTPPVSKVVGLMEKALEGLNGLLNSILDLSRLDAGVVMPQVAAVDVGALLERLSQEYTLLAEVKGLRVKAVGPALTARTDPILLERMVRNLIENAIRYTNDGGILLSVRQRGDRARLDVADSGIGIADDKLPHIFEEFYQVGNPGRDRSQGLGLGLAIVGRLARLLGVELQVKSREGRGTRFSLLLPLDRSQVEPADDSPETGEGSGHILIVEDDTAILAGLQLLAESWGYEVMAVTSGEEALDACSGGARHFDAIIADHRLGPGLTGTEAALKIRKMIGWPIPTVVVTGDTAPERIAEVHASCLEMLHKPVAAEELRHKLADLTRGARAFVD